MTASNRKWAAAYLRQAQEDFNAAKSEILQIEAPSVFCMLIQMVFEKIAKAALLSTGDVKIGNVRTDHKILKKFSIILNNYKRSLPPLHKDNWKEILNVAVELERLQPSQAGKNKPCLEYPWEDEETQSVKCPADDLPIVNRITSSRDNVAPRLIKFAGHLIEHFDKIF